MVDVVGEADGDAARGCRGERTVDDRVERRRQAEVVDRDLERVLRLRDEVGERVRRPLGGLAAVGERLQLDQGFAAARSDAL